MSAVAPAEYVPAATLEAVEAPAPGAEAGPASEMNRWMLWFGVPMLVAALLVAGVFATGQEWLMGIAAGVVVADIFVLVWLAMSSDTNGLSGEPTSH
jgi:hypothetical protein